MNWKRDQREYIIEHVYEFARSYQDPSSISSIQKLLNYHVTFPWFTDKKMDKQEVYLTSLLDFIELYDFVAGGEAE